MVRQVYDGLRRVNARPGQATDFISLEQVGGSRQRRVRSCG